MATSVISPVRYYDFIESYFYDREDGTETPCLLGVTHLVVKSSDYSSWDSDVDYYGYREVEFDVLYIDKTPAFDLETRATKGDVERWEEEIYEQYRG